MAGIGDQLMWADITGRLAELLGGDRELSEALAGHLGFAEGGPVRDESSWMTALGLATSSGLSGESDRHADTYLRQAHELADRLGDTTDGSVYDTAKNYMGGYDFASRFPDRLDDAERLARYYQFVDYMRARLLGDEGGMDDAVADYLENVQGVRAVGAAPGLAGDDLNNAAVKWAETHRRYATGGPVHTYNRADIDTMVNQFQKEFGGG